MFDPGDGESPRAFMQWKGTDVCMDFHCECGHDNHYDGFFAYIIRCAGCGLKWQMPTYVYPRKNQRTDGITPLDPIRDDD
jgi:hypothetical protein